MTQLFHFQAILQQTYNMHPHRDTHTHTNVSNSPKWETTGETDTQSTQTREEARPRIHTQQRR